ncbi:hypothetical protein QM012_005546 [Aureobasidium pullulans]|uniref:Uncharacterized protein n=1 Tax=Aureobasidium pullulans TaxID=5580 RepID=A0ABR0T638_AURPU
MSFKDAFIRLHLPFISSMATCCKKLYLLCLYVLLVSILLRTAVWGAIMFHTSRALVPLIVAMTLLSMVEGALVLATFQAINKKPSGYELPENSPYAGHPFHNLIHPAFRECYKDSLDATRNFSLPRERCLDIVTPANAPTIPIPGAYVATGIVSRIMSTCRPLPQFPVDSEDIPARPTQLAGINDVTILPLRIQKRDSISIHTDGEQSTNISDVKSLKSHDKAHSHISPTTEARGATTGHAAKSNSENFDNVKQPDPSLAVKALERSEFLSADFDKPPTLYAHMSMTEQIITGIVAEQYFEDIDQKSAKSFEGQPPQSPDIKLETPKTPARLTAPTIIIQQPTLTTPESIEYPAATVSGTPITRVVDPFLEIPTMTGRGSRRKK